VNHIFVETCGLTRNSAGVTNYMIDQLVPLIRIVVSIAIISLHIRIFLQEAFASYIIFNL